MGVDYYNCAICDDIFADCWYNGFCGNCGEWLCGTCYDAMREEHGELGEDHENASNYGEDAASCCDICTGEHIDPNEFLQFVIKKTGLSEEVLETEFREMKRGGLTHD